VNFQVDDAKQKPDTTPEISNAPTIATSVTDREPVPTKPASVLEKETEEELSREFSRNRTRGFIVRCDGEYATVCTLVERGSSEHENYWAVGQLISIKVGHNRVVGLTNSVTTPEGSWSHDGTNEIQVVLELVGEIVAGQDGEPDKFSSGIANYPQMGCVAHRIRSSDLEIIYRSEGASIVRVGNLTQDATVDAKIDIDKLLSRHFAVVGTTGVGKSTSVTLILRKIVKVRPDIRVLMLDPHNEFASAFPNEAMVIDSSTLILPFWLFKLDEFAEVVFRGQSGFESEVELLRDLIPLAKEIYRSETEKSGGIKKKTVKTNLTADMPIPYRIIDLLKLIDDRLGLLEGKAEKPVLKSLQYRLESITTDPRFRFMFDAASGGDIMESIISRIFRVPHYGKPISVLEMSGLPTEVVNSVVSVLCRMAFELAMNSDGGIQTLVVCEEAHRYIPADEKSGFWPTRQSIARIAKEGRKYGVFLSIITQRPGELDPTILSQCNTVFAMRLGNQRDQEIISGAVSNGAKSTISFLSSIANRECIAFGEAIHTPMRMTFETMSSEDLPGARIYEQQAKVKDGLDVSLTAVMRRMRQQDKRPSSDESYVERDLEAAEKVTRARQASSAPSGSDEINSILNAAYSSTNTSLNPSLEENAAAMSAAAVVTTKAQKATLKPAPPEVEPVAKGEPAKKTGGGTANLIASFRKR